MILVKLASYSSTFQPVTDGCWFYTLAVVTAGGGMCSRTNARNGIFPGRVERHRMRACKRTLAVRCRRGQRKGLIYVHKSMGKVLSRCVIWVGLRLASSCKAIPPCLSQCGPIRHFWGQRSALQSWGGDDLRDLCEYSYNGLLWPHHTS